MLADDDNDDKCTVIVALMQKNRRAQRKFGLDCLTIGFTIYHVCYTFESRNDRRSLAMLYGERSERDNSVFKMNVALLQQAHYNVAFGFS